MISGRLKTEREDLGLSQQALADRLGISLRSQQNYEKGDRNPDSAYLAAIAAAGADVLYILTGQHADTHSARDQAEQVLLDSYRRCGAAARQHLIQTAALLAAGVGADLPAGMQPASISVSSKHGHAAGRDVNVRTEGSSSGKQGNLKSRGTRSRS